MIRAWLVVFGFIALVIAAMFVSSAGAKELPPNVLVVMVDDYDADMDQYFPAFSESAAVFPNFIYSTALCCPTRATLLSGMYAWNTGITGNDPGEARFRNRLENNALPVKMKALGYRTGYFGKYMNGYEDNHVPNGWDEWHAWTRVPSQLLMVHNGKMREHSGHYDDVTGMLATEFVQTSAQPFYAVVSFYSPHGPRKVEDRHRDLEFPAETDRQEKRIKSTFPAYEHFQNLRAQVPPNTVVMFLTDNGYHTADAWYSTGRPGKNTPFTTDAQVPLRVWRDGLNGGIYNQLVTTVDIFSTVTDFGGGRIDRDGLSIRPYLDGVEAYQRQYVPQWHRDWGWSNRSVEWLYLSRDERLYRVGVESSKSGNVPVEAGGGIVQSMERLKDCRGGACLDPLPELRGLQRWLPRTV
jgi:N-acetylglucosamine-6-sulfatase